MHTFLNFEMLDISQRIGAEAGAASLYFPAPESRQNDSATMSNTSKMNSDICTTLQKWVKDLQC
jgi:hypothetical protein